MAAPSMLGDVGGLPMTTKLSSNFLALWEGPHEVGLVHVLSTITGAPGPSQFSNQQQDIVCGAGVDFFVHQRGPVSTK